MVARAVVGSVAAARAAAALGAVEPVAAAMAAAAAEAKVVAAPVAAAQAVVAWVVAGTVAAAQAVAARAVEAMAVVGWAEAAVAVVLGVGRDKVGKEGTKAGGRAVPQRRSLMWRWGSASRSALRRNRLLAMVAAALAAAKEAVGLAVVVRAVEDWAAAERAVAGWAAVDRVVEDSVAAVRVGAGVVVAALAEVGSAGDEDSYSNGPSSNTGNNIRFGIEIIHLLGHFFPNKVADYRIGE